MKILIIEDDIVFSKILQKYLSRNGYETITAPDISSAKVSVNEKPDLILLDFHLPDGNGLDVLQHLNSLSYKTPTIIMTSFHDIKTAVECIKKGAADFITKPINQDELLMLIGHNIHQPASSSKVTQPASLLANIHSVKGTSDIARQLYAHIDLVAETDMSVLIIGESGTGKEHVARAVHQNSRRSEKPFIAIDCGALSNDLANSELFGHVKGSFTGALFDKKGQLEMADGGTIFLDEIGNLSYEVQVKLLRVIQERELTPVGGQKSKTVDVRIISATNENFSEAIANGKFREDLFHRINEFSIKMPSLAQRKEDLNEFISFFIQESNRELNKKVKNIDDKVKKIFHSYHWPGNIRELKNVIKRAVLLSTSEVITAQELPDEMEISIAVHEQLPQESDLKQAQEILEKELIIKTLKETNYNKSKTAKILNIDRTTLYNKIAKYNIE